MYPYVYIEVTLSTKRFITHITIEWTLSTMYNFMHLEVRMLRKNFITHGRNADDLPYVSLRVPSGDSYDKMIYYTHHKCMDELHYVHFHAS
jgi:hypothetical protein